MLSFWLDSPDGKTPNEFLVSWNGNTLLDRTNLPATGWTNIQFVVTATGTSTVLQFGFRDDPSYLGLDDISVVASQPAQLRVTTTSLPNGTNGLAYSQQLSAVYGQPPYHWSLISGSLPSGLALATNGVISGTPTANGTNYFTVKVTDALSATATQPLTLTISSSLSQQPDIIGTSLSGTNLVLNVTDGHAGATYYVLSSTNVVLPLSQWTLVATNILATSGNFTITVTNTVTLGIRQRFYILQYTPAIPTGMALIPAGSFTMGDTLDGESDAMPTVSVTVSAFYMDTNLVSYSQWLSVYNWATSQGYGFVDAGAGKAANHPVQTVDWYDTVKWCNARSQQAGLTPVYYADAGLTQVYTNGETTNVFVNWAAGGYRLPTEAEWEKAARGGAAGHRFP